MRTEGALILPETGGFLSDIDLERLEQLAEALPREHVSVGDAGEPNYLEVGRFLTDAERTKAVSGKASEEAVSIVSSARAMEFYKQVLGLDDVYVRRMQYNILGAGCYVGYHLDTDSNPDYLTAVVIQFGREFNGGAYVVYTGDETPLRLSPGYRSIIFSRCDLPHEVSKVESGSRRSLVYFLSGWGGDNRRWSSEA